MSKMPKKIEIENFTSPGGTTRVDKQKYTAMRTAVMKVMSKKIPGRTYAEIKEQVLRLLPAKFFPKGEKAGWWLKTVQLDLEAKGVIEREDTKPLRLHKV